MSIPAAYMAIVDSLAAATDAGRAQWYEVPTENFELQLSGSIFRVYVGTDDDLGMTVVGGTLFNDKGERVDNFYVYEGNEGYSKMFGLYEGAKRKARKVDQILEALKQELGSPGDIGKRRSI